MAHQRGSYGGPHRRHGSYRRRPPGRTGLGRAARVVGPTVGGLVVGAGGVVLVLGGVVFSVMLVLVAVFLGVALIGLGAGGVLLAVLKAPVLVLLLLGGLSLKRSRRRAMAAGTAPLPRHAAPRPAPPRPEQVWHAARDRFHALRAAYAAHECDPMAVLRLPALSDVTVPSTARFVDAFAEAQALETDAPPPASHAAAFADAVERAGRAWDAARDAAERIRLSNLAPAERGAVERVVKLLTTARDSDNDAERLAAYARARTELARLDRAGVIHLPRAAQAELEVGGRGRLTA